MLVHTGEYICLEGDKASSLYIVKNGMLVGSRKNSERLVNFGPGSIIGEFSLLENSPREYTLRAAEESEVLIIEQESLQATMDPKPTWLKSILAFLTSRNHIAQENKRKSDFVQSLPSLLFIFANHISTTETDSIPLSQLHERIYALNNSPLDEIIRLLDVLQDLGILKVYEDVGQEKIVRAESLQIIPLLYETLKYRALNHKVSPNILSMTDQMILTAFVNLARANKTPLKNGLCTIATEDLKAETKKTMHGLTLTSRTIAPLVQNGLLQPTITFDIHAPLENIPYFFADFEKVLDLLELNRIFPQLDKKLVN